jgi:hypothetical protein
VHLHHDAFGTVTLAREGEKLVTDSKLTPAFPRPPLHVHPSQAERFEVRGGRLRLTIGRSELLLGVGDSVTVPAGTPHTFAVEGADAVSLRAEFAPAGELARFFEGLHRLAHEGHIDARGRPRSLAVAPFALAHLGEFRLARAPARVQRALLRGLAGVSRRTRTDTWLPCAPSP